MMRINLSFDSREYRLAKKHARVLAISVAEFVRRAVREALTPGRQKQWMKFAGLVETGDSDASLSVDAWVYRQRH